MVVRSLGGETSDPGLMASNRDKLWQSASMADSSGKVTTTGLAAADAGVDADSGVEVSGADEV